VFIPRTAISLPHHSPRCAHPFCFVFFLSFNKERFSFFFFPIDNMLFLSFPAIRGVDGRTRS